MKRFLLIACTLILSISALIAVPFAATGISDYPITTVVVYTPQGTAVSVDRYLEPLKSEDIAAAKEECAAYESLGAVAIGDMTISYNCFTYAFLAREAETADGWLDDPSPYISDNSYIAIDEPEVGCVVTYSLFIARNYVQRDDAGDITERTEDTYNEWVIHAGVVVDVPVGATEIEDLTIESKWGYSNLYRHKGDVCPYYMTDLSSVSWGNGKNANTGTEIVFGIAYHYYRFNPDNFANKTMHMASEATSETVKNGLWTDEDGNIRYYINGQAQFAGAVSDTDGNIYYIDSSCKAVSGEMVNISSFRANSLLEEGTYFFSRGGESLGQVVVVDAENPLNAVVENEQGMLTIIENGEPAGSGILKFNEDDYYFVGNDDYAIRNRSYYITARNANGLLPSGRYTFGKDGTATDLPELLAGENYANGLIRFSSGKVQYMKNGKATYAGLIQSDDGDYYFIGSSLRELRNTSYSIPANKTNGLLPAGTYNFSADGKITSLPTILAGEDCFNGLIRMPNGMVLYLEDGNETYAGLVKSDDGDYYFIGSALRAVCNTSYTINAMHSNGLLPADTYSFDATGKLTNLPQLLAGTDYMNGLVKLVNGDIQYLIDGVATFAKLVKSDAGDLYYIDSSGQAVRDVTYYLTSSQTNGLLPSGNYTFDANGVLQNLPELLAGEDMTNGLVRMTDGDIQYLMDGCATYAGLVMSDAGDLYYIGSSLHAVTNTTFTIPEEMTNGLLPAGTYRFDEDGKLITETTVDPAA